MDTSTITFTLNNKHINFVIRQLIYLTIILTLLSITGQIFDYLGPVFSETLISKLNLNEEGNVPTYFTSMLLLLASTILALITLIKYKEKNSYKAKWMILAIVFLFLSMEEIAGFHEAVAGPLRSLLAVDGFFYYAWVIPAILMLGFLGSGIFLSYCICQRKRGFYLYSQVLYILPEQ
jgi:hypothetical protein